jgi:NAD+ kinase
LGVKNNLKIVLIRNEAKYDVRHVAESILKKLQHYGVEVVEENQKLTGAPNLILVLGGDGTIIRAARQYGMQGIPLLGINMGTVGFLSNIEAGEIEVLLWPVLKAS